MTITRGLPIYAPFLSYFSVEKATPDGVSPLVLVRPALVRANFFHDSIFFRNTYERIESHSKENRKTGGRNLFVPTAVRDVIGIKTASKIRFKCRKSLIYKDFSTCVYYSHSKVHL
jgi:hypothetical protein